MNAVFYIVDVPGPVCHELPGEANRTSKSKRGDMRNREYIEAIKVQTQNGK